MEFKRKRIVVTVVAILCLATMFITANMKTDNNFLSDALGVVITPIQNVTSKIINFFEDRINFLLSMNNIHKENQRLQTEIAQLAAENKRLQQNGEENKRLSELFEIDQKYGEYPKVGAEIISRDPNDWFDAYTINKGTKHGLEANMPVLGPGGVLGMITECHYNYSVVVTLIDDRSSISARCLRTEATGYVKGDSLLMKDGLCRMDYIDIDAQIMPGDEIVTSSFSVFYPPGLSIGLVKDVRTDPNGLTKYAIISPTVKLSQIETVLVITQTFNQKEQ